MRLVPDELWMLVEPVVPEFRARPQGGGTAPLPARAVFTAIVYVLTSGCSWRDLPPSFGVPFQTAHRRFGQWTKRGSLTGPSPVDRGKPDSKIHVVKPLVKAIPAIRSRCGPRRRKPDKPHTDKAYDHTELRAWVRQRGIRVRIARKGVETNEKLGRHRWMIERTISWLTGYRRPTTRYERKANHFLAFLTPRRSPHLLQETTQSGHVRHGLRP